MQRHEGIERDYCTLYAKLESRLTGDQISDDRVSYLTNAEALAHLHDVRQRYEPLPGYKTQTEAEAEEIKARGPLTSQQRSAVKKPIFHDLKTGLGEVSHEIRTQGVVLI